MLRQRKFFIGGVIIAVTIGYLGFMGFSGAATYYYTVGELLEMGSDAYGQAVRVNGAVVAGSVSQGDGGFLLGFTVADDGGSLPVVYEGVVPDTFKDDADVVVEGTLDESGVFQADVILMKCPSKYEPESDSEPESE